MLQNTRILLIIAGGIAAFKSLELIRRLRERGSSVRCILTHAGAQFVTPLSVAALSEDRVYADLFSLTDESEMGHIRLSREADLVVVAPATADILAKMANGMANDLASTALLATDKPVLVAPGMNVEMWNHPATQRNIDKLKTDGIRFVGPDAGDLACGEVGVGRMAEALDIVAAIENLLRGHGVATPLQGRRALVTAGATREPIDPVRYLSNHSSGKQGYAIADALCRLGAQTTLVSGPTTLDAPQNVEVIDVETADQMMRACTDTLPVDIAVCAAAVADWRVANQLAGKIKKTDQAPVLDLVENPDILATLSRGARRPSLVVGFAAETDDLIVNATAKLKRKGCDWLIANSVANGSVFGEDENQVHLITVAGDEAWPKLSKIEVAVRIATRVAEHFASAQPDPSAQPNQ